MVRQWLPGWFANDFRKINRISRDRSFLGEWVRQWPAVLICAGSQRWLIGGPNFPMVRQWLPGWFANDFREINHISRDRSFLAEWVRQ